MSEWLTCDNAPAHGGRLGVVVGWSGTVVGWLWVDGGHATWLGQWHGVR